MTIATSPFSNEINSLVYFPKAAGSEAIYYSITVQSTSQLNVVVKEKETEGMVWLFVSAGQFPTLLDHEESDYDTQGRVRRISLEFSSPRSGVEYFVGVYGTPFAQRDVEFDISIFYTPFK